MKSFSTEKKLIAVIVAVLIAGCCVISYFGYNEYIYNKIGEYIMSENLQLAEIKLESISSAYKDVDKVKMLLHTVNNFDESKTADYERTITQLEGFKGFRNTNINYYYNNFYRRVISLNSGYIASQSLSVPTVSETYPSITQYITTTAPQTEIHTTTENTYSTVTEYNSTTQAYSEVTEQSTSTYSQSEIVYYVESGEVYHVDPSCRTLAKSTNVYSGPVPEGRRACKVCG